MGSRMAELRNTKKKGEDIAFCHNRISKYINKNEYSDLRKKLCGAIEEGAERYKIKDIVLRGSAKKDLGRSNVLNEKYIVRFSDSDKNKAFLIKESAMGNKIKEVIEHISYETAMRIVENSTKWLCSSTSPLIRELGVKMTTEILRPDAVISYDRESFKIDNRINVTADSCITLCEYDAGNFELCSDCAEKDPVDGSICLLQINYERIIPEYLAWLIGIKSR